MSAEVTSLSPNPDFLSRVVIDEEFDESTRERVQEQYFQRKFAYRQVEALAYVCEHPEIPADSIVSTIAESYGLHPESYNKAVGVLKDKELILTDNNENIVPSSDAWVVLAMLWEDPSKIAQRRTEKDGSGKLYEIVQYIHANTDEESDGWLRAEGQDKSVYERIADNVSSDHRAVMRYVSRLRGLKYVEIHKEGEHKGALVTGVRFTEIGARKFANQFAIDTLFDEDEVNEIDELESLQETCLDLARMVGDTAVSTAIEQFRELNEAAGYKNIDIEAQTEYAIRTIEQLRFIVRTARAKRFRRA